MLDSNSLWNNVCNKINLWVKKNGLDKLRSSIMFDPDDYGSASTAWSCVLDPSSVW